MNEKTDLANLPSADNDEGYDNLYHNTIIKLI